MEIKDVKLKQPLLDVKRAEDKNDVLICPGNCTDEIIAFLKAYDIPYTRIENPKLYPVEDINRQLEKYIEPISIADTAEEIKELVGVSALITPFDANALFDWAMQILAIDCDPAYDAYCEAERQEADAYYEAYAKESP